MFFVGDAQLRASSNFSSPNSFYIGARGLNLYIYIFLMMKYDKFKFFKDNFKENQPSLGCPER
jgi:hypothetical protein